MTRRRAPSHLIDRVLSLKLAVVVQVRRDEAEVGWLAGSRGSYARWLNSPVIKGCARPSYVD